MPTITNATWNQRELARIERIIKERGTTLAGYRAHYAKPANRDKVHKTYTADDVYAADVRWHNRVKARMR